MALIKDLKFSIKMQKGLCHEIINNLQWWIKNFSEGGGQLPKSYYFANILPKTA